MIVNIYHVISGGLLAKMGAVNSVEQAKLEYAETFLEDEFSSYDEFRDRNPHFEAGLYAVALN